MAPNPNPAGRVVVVGTLNVDHIWQVPVLPRPGQTILATAAEQQFGGKGANQAMAAARQGARVTMVGAVGDDGDGRRYRERLEGEGIAVGSVAVLPGAATGAAHVYVDPAGENLIVVDRGANARLDPACLAVLLPHADLCVLQLECALDAAVEAIRRAAQHGVRVLLNAAPSHAAFPWGRHPIDTVVVNEHECVDCCACSPAVLAGLPAAARRTLLAARQVSHVVVTQGAGPTLHVTAESVEVVPAHPVQPIDTVGAGDMFTGTLAAELAAGRAWPLALRRANVAAALSTLALGAQAAMPTRAAVDAILNSAAG